MSTTNVVVAYLKTLEQDWGWFVIIVIKVLSLHVPHPIEFASSIFINVSP